MRITTLIKRQHRIMQNAKIHRETSDILLGNTLLILLNEAYAQLPVTLKLSERWTIVKTPGRAHCFIRTAENQYPANLTIDHLSRKEIKVLLGLVLDLDLRMSL